ncbi:uncharacterized protein LOC141686076 [Apium graveolens]|uniref:uncharacterized protein LOC141686076 n=1 Tax=Apium graveolens TaxID=4045 RepID=UPI003D79302D
MGSPWKLQFLKDLIRQERPDVVFLCETLSNKVQMEKIRLKIQFQGMIVVEPQGRSGGLALLWRDSDQAKLLSLSQNHIDVELTIRDLPTWRLTGDSNLPWCTIGDLNNIVSQLDKRGGAAYPQKLIDGFNNVLLDTGLRDMELHGHPFTWERGRNTDNWLEIRLDRALVSPDWLDLFPMSKLYTIDGSPSDHSPIFLDPKLIESVRTKKRFRFENA